MKPPDYKPLSGKITIKFCDSFLSKHVTFGENFEKIMILMMK